MKWAYICTINNAIHRVIGELAEWSNAAVLKTVEGHTSGGSNPSLSATYLISTYKIPYFNGNKGFFFAFNLYSIHLDTFHERP